MELGWTIWPSCGQGWAQAGQSGHLVGKAGVRLDDLAILWAKPELGWTIWPSYGQSRAQTGQAGCRWLI
ncbi:hypothetical protein [Streptococcus halichoeri]|uniref:hypothetical protein n=1 Tax=Streptococcus halichoeri TaxID=254785 RepID=UPI00135C5D94|nr:hypothetical protein [Streptococcus halichoeri]